MKLQFPNLKYTDATFWTIFALLIFVSSLALFSASSTLVYKSNSPFGTVGGQIAFMLIGVVVAFGLQFLPSKYIRLGGYALLAVSLVMVYSLLIPNNPFIAKINGEGRWLKLFGVRFQPSELVKLSLVIVVADMLSRAKTDKEKKKYFFITLGITAFAAAPIMVSNFSTAFLLCGVVFLLWVLGRIPWQYLVSTAAIVAVVAVVGFCIADFGYVRKGKELPIFSRAETWIKRIDRYQGGIVSDDKTAEVKITDANRQEVYATVAIARGGISPIGVLPGNSKERDYLPLAFADYIFAIIVEESGLVGAIFVIFLYLSLLGRACITSTKFSDMSAMLMVMGLALMITCQALMSMWVAVGLMPVTGQPLPFISKGGTSVLVTSVYLGIMMCVSREQSMLLDRQKATIDASENDVPDIEVE